MAKAGKTPMVKLICGMISADKALLERAVEELVEIFGPADLASKVMDFDFTHYYDGQMGSPLYRSFVGFKKLISPDALIQAKCATNEIEEQFANQAKGSLARPINLDPGYVNESKLVLASMKDFSHRIYLGRGVFAEVTLMYRKGKWQPLAWTFPDYASGRYDEFLAAARDTLRQQRSSAREADE